MLPVSRQHFVPIDGYRNGLRYNDPVSRAQDCTWKRRRKKNGRERCLGMVDTKFRMGEGGKYASASDSERNAGNKRHSVH